MLNKLLLVSLLLSLSSLSFAEKGKKKWMGTEKDGPKWCCVVDGKIQTFTSKKSKKTRPMCLHAKAAPSDPNSRPFKGCQKRKGTWEKQK